MATPGRPLPEEVQRAIQRLDGAGWTVRAIAAELRVSTRTVQKYVRESNTTSEPALSK